MRSASLLLVLIAACRCASDPTSVSAPLTPVDGPRLELADELTQTVRPVLALGWMRDVPVMGSRGSLAMGDRSFEAPAYLGAPVSVAEGVVRAWPYELRDETPTELPIPEGPPVHTGVWRGDAWWWLRGDASSRELVVGERTWSVPGADVIAFDGERVVAAGNRVWLLDGELRELARPHYAVAAVSVTEERVLALDANGQMVVWSVSDGSATTLVAHLGAGRAMAVSDGRLATGGADGRVAVWRLADLPPTGRSAEPIAETTFAGPIDALVWTPGERPTLAVAVTEGRRSRLVRLRLVE